MSDINNQDNNVEVELDKLGPIIGLQVLSGLKALFDGGKAAAVVHFFYDKTNNQCKLSEAVKIETRLVITSPPK